MNEFELGTRAARLVIHGGGRTMADVITFDDRNEFTSSQWWHGDSTLWMTDRYREDGFTFTSSWSAAKLVDWGGFTYRTDGASLASSSGLVMAKTDGGSFGVSAFDAHGFWSTSYEWAASTRFLITGVKTDGSVVSIELTTDNEFGLQTFHLPEGFQSDLVQLTWYGFRDGYLPNGRRAGDTLVIDNVAFTSGNRPPAAVPDSADTAANEAVTVDVLANDSDPDVGAKLTLVGAAGPEGRGGVSVADGKLVFDPGADFADLPEGARQSVVLTYIVVDQNGARSESNVTVTVTGVNDAPVAQVDKIDAAENTPMSIDVLANDTDVDHGAVLTLVSGVAPEGKGAVAIIDGRLVWTPAGFDHLAAGATETVTLRYTVRDEHGATSQGVVEATVTGVNDAPVALADAVSGGENETLTLNVLANDVDPDAGAVLTLVDAAAPAGRGAVSIVNGALVFTPGTSFDHLGQGATETVTLTYSVQDEHGATATSTATVTVMGVNDAPVAAADVGSVLEDAAVSGSVLLNDRDVDAGDRLSVTGVSFGDAAGVVGAPVQGRYGTLTMAADGNYSYAADADLLDTLTDAAGLTDVFTYQVSDGRGGVTTATLTLQVGLVNDARTTTGGSRKDVLNGVGPETEDTLYGLKGDDTLNGGGGADWLYGGDGDDVLNGGTGRDRLFGEDGDDRLDGGAGDDVLSGGEGRDVLTGGAGADVFVFGRSGDFDLVTDFEVGVDRLSFTGGVTAVRVLQWDVDGNGVLDTLLQLSDGYVALLDTGPASLSDFVT